MRLVEFAMAAFLVVAALPLPAVAFELHGHRGTRGHAPENTLAAFRKALEIGVTHIETDLAITKDGQVVISHEPALNQDLVRLPNGKWLSARGPAISTLTLSELKQLDIGRINPQSRYAQQWKEQVPSDGERFPTLAELFALVQASGNVAVRFNIEIKTVPDGVEPTPDPETFARLVLAEIDKARMAQRVMVQSFDWRSLRAIKRLASDIETSCLTIESPDLDTVQRGKPGASPWLAGIDVDQLQGSVPRAVKQTGCAVWSPFWRNPTPETLQEAKALGLRVVPWTVNDPARMEQLIAVGIDGLITDYPDRAREVMQRHGMKLP